MNSIFSTVVVTVTYGQRWHLLRQAVISAKRNNVQKMIVVDNGARDDVRRLAQAEFGDFVDTCALERNIGSAGGYNAGFKKALAHKNTEFVLALDDDNVLSENAVANLREKFADEISRGGVMEDSLAISCYRPQRDDRFLRTLLSDSKPPPRRGAFMGFHILDIPRKIARRLAKLGSKEPSPNAFTRRLTLQAVPWSGLFFHRSLIDRHGLPNSNLVLYCDDIEYTTRITSSGGRIVKCMSASVADLDIAWNQNTDIKNSVDAMLLGEGDLRCYYDTRNATYLDILNQESSWTRAINKRAYLTLIYLRAIQKNRLSRWRIVKRAVTDGSEGRLGLSEEFPLD